MKRLLSPLAAACLLAAAVPAHAGPYSAMYVFGDSLSDAGQFPDADGPAGSTVRFTNREGPTYLDGSGEIFGSTSPMLIGAMLGLGLQTPSTSSVFEANGWEDGNNWAVGGYRTDEILNSITAPGGSTAGTRTRDGFLVDLANRGLTLDSNALYYVNGGGNDFLQGLVLNTAQAQAAAGRLVDSVEALQGAGARYIMVSLLPDVGRTPALGGGNAFFSGLASDLNTELVSQLRGMSAEIIPLNLPALVNEVLADPAPFGLDASQDLTGTCFDGCANVNPTWGIGSATPDPSKLVFNDGVHPTTAVQQIAADYAYSLLSAPMELTLLPEMAHGSLRNHQDQLTLQGTADAASWQPVGQWRGFVAGGTQRQDIDAQDSSAAGDGDGYNLNMGASWRVNDAWMAGGAIGLYQQGLEVGAADSEYDMSSYMATVFTRYQQNRWWGTLAGTMGILDYNSLERSMNLGITTRTEKGDTKGDLLALGGRVGFDVSQPDGDWQVSPFLSADYASVNVDGYAENGNRSTAMSFADQQRDSVRFGAGLLANYTLSASTALFGECAYELESEDDTTELAAELNSLPGISFQLKGYTPGDSLARAMLGVSHALSKDMSLRGGYVYSQADDDARHGLSLSLSMDL